MPISARAVSAYEQFRGCLVGQCLGDALGFPVEGESPEVCSSYVAALRSTGGTSCPPPGAHYTTGQYTDDSQLARELMDSFATMGRFDPADYAARIAAIFAENRIVGRGFATDAAARRLINGVHWEEAGTPPPQAGNGTAMRAAPVGLLFGDDPPAMVKMAHDQGRITHKDPRCSAGSVAIAGAVALATQSETISVPAFLRQLNAWMLPFHEPFAQDVLRLERWIELPVSEAAEAISRSVAHDFNDGWKWISPYVVPSVLWSLYSFLRSPEDYWETICASIECGGDVDTTAAMAGAISGAHLGLQRIPLQPAKALHDQGTWGLDELIELSDRCSRLTFDRRGGRL